MVKKPLRWKQWAFWDKKTKSMDANLPSPSQWDLASRDGGKKIKSGKTKQETFQVYFEIILNAIIPISLTFTYHQYVPAVISQIHEQARWAFCISWSPWVQVKLTQKPCTVCQELPGLVCLWLSLDKGFFMDWSFSQDICSAVEYAVHRKRKVGKKSAGITTAQAFDDKSHFISQPVSPSDLSFIQHPEAHNLPYSFIPFPFSVFLHHFFMLWKLVKHKFLLNSIVFSLSMFNEWKHLHWDIVIMKRKKLYIHSGLKDMALVSLDCLADPRDSVTL